MLTDVAQLILTNIVDHPDDVRIDETQEGHKTIIHIHVHPEDIGKVIGKQGRIIHAIRDIVKLAAAKQNIYADVYLEEESADITRDQTETA